MILRLVLGLSGLFRLLKKEKGLILATCTGAQMAPADWLKQERAQLPEFATTRL
jgi:hypothetical protein